jgi:outer membrane protein assembly factor BamA
MRILLTSLLLMTSVAPPALAQSAAARFAGRPIEDIRLLTESTPTTDAALLGLIETRVGEALSIAAVRASIAHLYGLGRFQDVQVEAADAPGGGVALKFNLIPIHSIRQIEFAGDLRLSRGLLRRTVVERYGASPQLGRVDAAARTLQQLYQDNGYLRARVEAVPEIRHNPDQTVLTFNIDAGPRSTIGRLEIDGDPRVPRQQFLRSIDAAPGEPYLRPRLQERVEAYVRKLKERRFYEASGAVQATESEDGTKVDLLITIHPGLPVTVRFEGDPLPAERMTELAPLQREGSLDEDLLEDSETRIEGYLRQQGYWKADATVRREEANGALTVVFGVTKGRQYRVAERRR